MTCGQDMGKRMERMQRHLMVYEYGEQGWSRVLTEAFLGEMTSCLGFAFKYSVGGWGQDWGLG